MPTDISRVKTLERMGDDSFPLSHHSKMVADLTGTFRFSGFPRQIHQSRDDCVYGIDHLQFQFVRETT